MKIILLQKIKTLGKAGEIKEVAEGYAQNFLIPKKMAEAATEDGIEKVEARQAEEKRIADEKTKKLKGLAEKLKNEKIILKLQEKDGKLFGSVSAKQVCEELQKRNLAVSPESVIMEKAIKETGTHEVRIKLDKEISAKIVLEIQGL